MAREIIELRVQETGEAGTGTPVTPSHDGFVPPFVAHELRLILSATQPTVTVTVTVTVTLFFPIVEKENVPGSA